jgi:hypothetical protein
MSANQTIHLTQTLANDSRAQIKPWLEEFETHARNLCAQHDATGALTLVASDQVWRPSTSRPSDLGSTLTPRQQRCGRCSLPLQNGGYTSCGLQHGQQYPQHCPIGQCWGEKPEPPQDDLPRPEVVHALSARNSRHHACQARCRY